LAVVILNEFVTNRYNYFALRLSGVATLPCDLFKYSQYRKVKTILPADISVFLWV